MKRKQLNHIKYNKVTQKKNMNKCKDTEKGWSNMLKNMIEEPKNEKPNTNFPPS